MRAFSILLLVAALAPFTSPVAAELSSPSAKRDTQIDAHHDSTPRHYGERWFYTRSGGTQNQNVLYVADSLDTAPRALLDPGTSSKGGTVALKQWTVSDDGQYVAYGLSSGGSGWEEWHVLDVDAAKPTDDVLKRVKFSTTSWRRDGTGFFYSRYDEHAKDAADKFQKLYFHRLGENQDDDLLIYENKDQPDWTFAGEVSDDGRWLIVRVARGDGPNNLVMYRDLAKPYRQKGEKKKTSKAAAPGPNVRNMQGKKIKTESVVTPIETLIGDWSAAWEFLGSTKNTLYFLTDADAPSHRIVAIDVDNPGKANWKDIVPQAKDRLQSARIVNRSLVAAYTQDARSIVRTFDLKGNALGDIALPGAGTVSDFSGRPRDPVVFYTFSPLAAPPAIYRYDLSLRSGGVWRAPESAQAR
jgi:prolyl oligopeptidase